MANSVLWENLDKELNTMVDQFSNLIKAARIPEEEAEQINRRERAPGDLLEVFAEKLLHSGHTALHIVSQLKRGAMTTDFSSLVKNVKDESISLGKHANDGNRGLSQIRKEAEQLLQELEASYNSSSYRGELVVPPMSPQLQELARLAISGG